MNQPRQYTSIGQAAAGNKSSAGLITKNAAKTAGIIAKWTVGTVFCGMIGLLVIGGAMNAALTTPEQTRERIAQQHTQQVAEAAQRDARNKEIDEKGWVQQAAAKKAAAEQAAVAAAKAQQAAAAEAAKAQPAYSTVNAACLSNMRLSAKLSGKMDPDDMERGLRGMVAALNDPTKRQLLTQLIGAELVTKATGDSYAQCEAFTTSLSALARMR